MLYRLPPWKMASIFSTLEQVLDWSLSLIAAPLAWARTRGSYTTASGETKRVKILVIDTGIQIDPMTKRSNHPDLIGAFVAARDFTNSPLGVQDHHGHGTATAALIAANNNETGIVGVCSDADVWIAKGLGDDGSGDNRGIAAAVDWGRELDVDIISFSGGSPLPDPDLHEAIDRFLGERDERFFIAAAGNDGTPNSVNFPASHPEVLAVGAVDRNGATAEFSSRGEQVDCAGPGVGVKSCNNSGAYGAYNGTSFACPLIAGVVGLMLAWHRQHGVAHKTPLKKFADLIEHIKRATVQMQQDPEGQGWGILNADKATELLPDEKTEPEKPIVQVQIGPFIWSMPAQLEDLASIGIRRDVPEAQQKQAARALNAWIGAMEHLGDEGPTDAPQSA